MKKRLTIILIIVTVLIGLFIFSQTSWGEKIVTIYKTEKIKRLTISQIDFSDANFILTYLRKNKRTDELKKITRDDLKRMIIRDAVVSDLPAVIDMHNRGLKKGVWCDMPYKTSTWVALNEYKKLMEKHGKENIYIRVGEIDGKIVTAMGGINFGDKAFNNFTFIDVDVDEKLWSEILIKISTNFFELARSLKLDIIEAKIEKDVWVEGFVRDIIRGEEMGDGVWRIDGNFNLTRTWTREEYEYDNDAVRKKEEKNRLEEDTNYDGQQELIGEGKIISQTENSDTFEKKDGTREMLIYPSPVNIEIDRQWMKIDDYLKKPEEILEEKSEVGKKFQLKPYEVYVGVDDENKNIISYNKDDNQVSFSLQYIAYKDQNKNIVLAEAEVGDIARSYKATTFKNIFSGIDLKYHSTKNGIKEELFFNNLEIFKKIDEPDYFEGKIILRTKITVSPNIDVEMLNDQIYFKKDGQNIFSTSQPFIFDQENKTYQVGSELKKEGGSYYLEITLDYGWMTSEEKVFPLVLDPDLNINPTADVSLCSNNTCAVNSGTGRVFIKFNISGIPTGMTLQSASLILTDVIGDLDLVSTVTARRFINQAWSEASALSVFTGGSFGNVLSTVTTGANLTETWNVLGSSSDGLIKEYNDGNIYYSIYLNNGVAFTPTYVSNGTALVLNYLADKATALDTYYSREGATPPVLRINYVPTPLTSNSSNSTIFDYLNHPIDAKSILNVPGLGGVNFRK